MYETLGEEPAVWGLTVAEHPRFWFYVPYSLSTEVPIEFVLQDESQFGLPDKDQTHIYKTTFSVPGQSQGIISLSLPSTVPPLEIGKKYYWKLSILFDPEDASTNKIVHGWIERIAPSADLMSQLKAANPREKALLYAKEGVWYEALTTLAELRRTHPRDATLANDWASLLRAVDLEDIADKPIAQCCTAQQ
jgi:hypothetical protein